MIYTPELFEEARQIIDARRLDAEAAREARDRAFDAEEPDYRRWRLQRAKAAQNVVKALDMPTVDDAKAYLEKLMQENLAAQEEIKRLLDRHGLPENHLEVHYTCPKCEDTGSVGTEICDCMVEVLRDLAFREAAKKSPLRFCEFEDFDLKYYSDEYLPEYGCSAKERMRQIYTICRQYADEFDPRSENLFLSGPTGLGKTHLSLAIAGEVIRKGYTVLYNSAQNLFAELNREYFGKPEDRGQYESLVLGCDLLVIDDLGVEFSSAFSRAELYNIINTRLNTRRPTIISSNLTLKGIEEAYSQRISSRLIGDYLQLQFIGADVRQKKAAE
ncbi:MAG: ATP-binding protein [Clostridia bacterium]|nr:ATP-binding protein [Clostridia bacterium]